MAQTIDELQVLITAQTKQFKQALSEVYSQLDNTTQQTTTMSKKSVAAFGAIAGAAQVLVSRGINLITSSIGNAAKRIDTLNNSQRVFQNLGFSAKDTKAQMDFLDKSIRGLPTTLNDAVSGVEALASVSGNLKDSTKTYKALNDGILAMGGSADEVRGAILQLSQLPLDGPLDAQTWNSLRQNGLTPVMVAMSKDMGLSISQMKDDFGSGKLTVQDFTNELQKLDKEGGGGMASLEKQAKDATHGITTGWANMQTAVTRGVADIIKAIGSENISNAISTFGRVFEQALSGIATAIPVVVTGLGQIAGAALSLAPFLVLLGSGFVALEAKMAIDATINAVILGFNNLRLIVLPGVLATFETLEAFLTTPFGAALLGVTLAVGLVTSQLLAQKHQTDQLKQAEQDLKKSTDDLKNAQDRLKQSSLDVEGSQLAVEQAQKNYNNTVRDFGPQSLQARQALHDLKQAQFDLKQAQDGTKKSQDDLHNAEIRVATDHRLIDHLHAVRDAAQQVGDKAFDAGQKIKRIDGSSITVKTTQNAVGQAVIDFKSSFGGGFASGGFTGQGGINEVAGIVHRGEYVLPQSAVDQSTGMPKLEGIAGAVNHITVKIGEDTIVDRVVRGINNKSFMSNATVLEI